MRKSTRQSLTLRYDKHGTMYLITRPNGKTRRFSSCILFSIRPWDLLLARLCCCIHRVRFPGLSRSDVGVMSFAPTYPLVTVLSCRVRRRLQFLQNRLAPLGGLSVITSGGSFRRNIEVPIILKTRRQVEEPLILER